MTKNNINIALIEPKNYNKTTLATAIYSNLNNSNNLINTNNTKDYCLNTTNIDYLYKSVDEIHFENVNHKFVLSPKQYGQRLKKKGR